MIHIRQQTVSRRTDAQHANIRYFNNASCDRNPNKNYTTADTNLPQSGRYCCQKFENVKPCSRLSTAHGPCLCNISWVQANWLKQYHAHKNKQTKKPCDIDRWLMTLILNRLLKVVKVCAQYCSCKISSSNVYRLISYCVNREKLCENNTAIASAGSNKLNWNELTRLKW